ncbi:hypothetical protein ACFL01_05095 [Planctomycetota bacterium]
MDNQISSVYHRLPFLNPDYDRVGLGITKRFTVADFGYGTDTEDTRTILYPADGQKEVPSFWRVNEEPNPVAQFGNPDVVGYPLSDTASRLIAGRNDCSCDFRTRTDSSPAKRSEARTMPGRKRWRSPDRWRERSDCSSRKEQRLLSCLPKQSYIDSCILGLVALSKAVRPRRRVEYPSTHCVCSG